MDDHCCFLSKKFVFLSFDGTQVWWLLILFYARSGALYPYILKEEKKDPKPSEMNRLTGTAVVVCHFQTARQDNIIRISSTEAIVPHHQSFLNLSVLFLLLFYQRLADDCNSAIFSQYALAK